MVYCIAQFEKVKSPGKITAMANHNLRLHLTVKDKKKVDKARTKLNQVLENPLDFKLDKARDMNIKLKAHWKENEIQLKSDSVLLVDLILSTSPEFWGEWHVNGELTAATKKKLAEWVPAQIDFIKKHFGPDALKFAVLHLDEKSPHIHIMLSPEQVKVLKYKNQYGSQEKRVMTLNAKRWNPTFWKKFLTAYAKANKQFGLKRPIEGSMAEKITSNEYNALIREAGQIDYTDTIEKMVRSVVKELGLVNSKSVVERVLNEKLVPTLKKLAQSNKALKRLLDLDRGKEYELLKKLQKEAEEKLLEASTLKKYHGNKLKAIQELEAKIEERDKIIEAQRSKIEGLELKRSLTANDFRYELKA